MHLLYIFPGFQTEQTWIYTYSFLYNVMCVVVRSNDYNSGKQASFYPGSWAGKVKSYDFSGLCLAPQCTKTAKNHFSLYLGGGGVKLH